MQVTLNGWDTHRDNFAANRQLMATLDPAMSTLFSDLRGRGLLESTLVVWMGEFGRTPDVNRKGGRDHYPKAWTAVLGGGGGEGRAGDRGNRCHRVVWGLKRLGWPETTRLA